MIRGGEQLAIEWPVTKARSAMKTVVLPGAEQRAGDVIHIESALTRIDTTSLAIHHRMFNSETGKLAATLEAVMLYFDLKARKKLPLPEADKARLAGFLVEATGE